MAYLVQCGTPEYRHCYIPRVYTLPNVNAAILISGFNAKSGLDLGALAGELHKQFREVHKGDLSRVEAMLLDQAHALQAVFTNLASRAQGARYLSQHQTFYEDSAYLSPA